jgi:hypothetical protein
MRLFPNVDVDLSKPPLSSRDLIKVIKGAEGSLLIRTSAFYAHMVRFVVRLIVISLVLWGLVVAGVTIAPWQSGVGWLLLMFAITAGTLSWLCTNGLKNTASDGVQLALSSMTSLAFAFPIYSDHLASIFAAIVGMFLAHISIFKLLNGLLVNRDKKMFLEQYYASAQYSELSADEMSKYTNNEFMKFYLMEVESLDRPLTRAEVDVMYHLLEEHESVKLSAEFAGDLP